MLGSRPGFGVVEAFILELEFAGLETFHRFEGLALIGTFAFQDLERLQAPGDQFIAQEDLHVGGRARAPAGRKNLFQSVRTIEAGAVQ